MLMARLIAETSECETRLATLADRLAGEGTKLISSDLAGEVLELRFDGGTTVGVLAAIDAVYAPADMLASDGEIAIPRLFVSDMDSTMIGQECIDELADYAGLKPQIVAITERAMQGELDFEAALR